MARYRFLDFALDVPLRRLSRPSGHVALGSRAFDLLAFLIAHRDRVVGREETMDAVWGTTVVGANNLSVQVGTVRRTLGAQAVLTVPGRGLRFGHPVEELPSIVPTSGTAPAPRLPIPRAPSRRIRGRVPTS